MNRTIQRLFTWPCDDDLAIIDMVTRDIHIVNATAAIVWRLLEEGGLSRDDICAILAEHYAVDRAIIDRDVTACLASWQAQGWIDGAAVPALQRTAENVPPYGNVHPPAPGAEPPAGAGITRRFRLPSGNIQTWHVGIEGSPAFQDMGRRLRHILSGFDQVETATTGAPAPDGPVLLAAAESLWLRSEGRWLWSMDNVEIMGRFLVEMIREAYADQPLLAILHAGLVGRDEGCVVLPGISGAGKSTLTGWLASHGWYFGGDDMIGLADGGTGLLALPFPTALSVKRGSWPILAPLYPSLMDQPVIRCAVRDARYVPLPPERHLPWTSRCRTVRAVVFPRYVADSAPVLTPIDLREALTLLSDSGITTGDHLDSDLLGRLFPLLDGLPIYRLTYADLAAAQSHLEALLSGDA